MKKQKIRTLPQYQEAELLLHNIHSHYSNIQYQQLTNDFNFEHVPRRLWKLWYQESSSGYLSVLNADEKKHSIIFSSDYEIFIEKLAYLLNDLEEEFKKLSK